MAELTDQEIVAACARAMGLLPYMNPPELTQHGMVVERLISGGVHSSSQQFFYNPLYDRAQASELQEKLRMNVRYTNQWIASCWITGTKTGMAIQVEADHPTNMLRAICLCAARVQIEKEKNA